ncbi:hypothetical protein HYW42_05030 [Candidatus Daviesbacteria bacterium]|nr:hypothetical protein [Candidatus Daviesbacteria bacterium]
MKVNIINPKTCYLCGSSENLTKDHIPPKNLFTQPLPGNLITVDCCKDCNQKHALDDEAFRVFTSSVINRSKAGEWIWNHKVMNSSFVRSPKLKENVKNSLVPLRDSNTGILYHGITLHESRVKPYLIKITKGLIRHFHPEADYSKSQFRVIMINPTQEIIDKTLVKFVYDERGDGIFRFWRAFYTTGQAESVWVYVFYDGLMFILTSPQPFLD